MNSPFFITLYNIKNAFVLETFVSFLAKSDTILNNLTYFIKNLEREENEKVYRFTPSPRWFSPRCYS